PSNSRQRAGSYSFRKSAACTTATSAKRRSPESPGGASQPRTRPSRFFLPLTVLAITETAALLYGRVVRTSTRLALIKSLSLPPQAFGTSVRRRPSKRFRRGFGERQVPASSQTVPHATYS